MNDMQMRCSKGKDNCFCRYCHLGCSQSCSTIMARAKAKATIIESYNHVITIMARARPQRRTTKTPPMFWTLSGWAWRTSVKGTIMLFEAYVKFKLELKGKEDSQGAWLCGLVWDLGVLALVLSGAHVPRVLPPLVVQHLNINNVNNFHQYQVVYNLKHVPLL